FSVAAFYMLGGHFVLTSCEWHNTEYLVTNQRVLIRHGIFSPRLTIYGLVGLPHTHVIMHGENIGNVMFRGPFGQGYGPPPGYQTMWPYTPGYVLGLMYIRDPRSVQGVIEQARAG
ncbi:MAG: PH domain-containing protein, partial [Chloroflexota bacterium]|nr:PH domain-containing protein [Chloroflexota bacterium]